MKARAYRYSLGLLVILPVLCLIIYLLSSSHIRRSSSDLVCIDQYLNEIGSAVRTFGALAPCANEVYYIHRLKSKNELCRLNLATHKTTSVPIGRSVQNLFDWSPVGRYLLIKTEDDNYEPTAKGGYAKPEWLLMLNRDDGKIIQITKKKMLISNYAVWLNDDSFLYSTLPIADPQAGVTVHLGSISNGIFQSQELPLPEDAMAAMSSRSKLCSGYGKTAIAYAGDSGIKVLDLHSGLTTPIPALSNEHFSGFNWLTWSPETRRLMFCATKTGESYRNVFAYDAGQETVERLSSVHSYNGQWLEQGKGHAYVGNVNNDFYMSITPHGGDGETNLFTNGFVERYTVSSSGDYLVALATTNAEPRGLWQYDFAAKRLSCLSPGEQVTFKHTKIVEAGSLNVRASDGLGVPCYVFPPADLVATNKYPLVVYVPPRTGQAIRGYEMRPQLLSNLGFYYISVNYRGCDGYGGSYSKLWNEEKAVEDVHEVIQQFSKQLQCDTQRVFAVSASAGSVVLQKLLGKYPALFRGAVFVGPTAWNLDEFAASGRLPRLFVSVGRNDPAFGFVQSLEDWTKLHSVPATYQYLPNHAHFDPDISKRIEQERAVAEFLLKNL